MEFIVPQGIGLIGLIFMITANYQKSKNRVLVFQILASLMFFIQYILLNAFTAGITFLVAIFRSFVFYYYDKKGKEKSVITFIIFASFMLILGVISYDDIFSIIPIISGIIYTYGIWQDDLRVFRKIAFIDPITWIIYNLHVGAYVGVMLSIIESSATLVAIIELDINKQRLKPENKS